jgi:putative ABC transport system permease protein
VERLGLGADPLGKAISYQGGQQEGTVIGVVKDFQLHSLREEISPAMIEKSTEPYAGYLAVRFAPGDPAAAVGQLEAAWSTFAPDRPLDYFFADEQFGSFYRAEGRLMQLFAVFAGLAVFIACLGLFGLAAFAAERRRKEIAVRKVLGATATQIVTLLSKDFLWLVGIGFLVATPLAYFAMRRWLEGFAYRIELGPLVFLAAGALALVVALAATGTQALRDE